MQQAGAMQGYLMVAGYLMVVGYLMVAARETTGDQPHAYHMYLNVSMKAILVHRGKQEMLELQFWSIFSCFLQTIF
jgi:hypothetical protein